MFQNKCWLRPVQYSDASILMKWENLPDAQAATVQAKVWTFEEILSLIESFQNFQETGQQRFMIECEEGTIGTVDFFESVTLNDALELGIYIEEGSRGRGWALQAMIQGVERMRPHSNLFFAQVEEGNAGSVRVFQKLAEALSELDYQVTRTIIKRNWHFLFQRVQ